MSSRLRILTIVLAIAYAAGVMAFAVKANSRRNFIALPGLVETDLAIPTKEFDMLALEMDKYIVIDDGAGGEVAGEGELLAIRHMVQLREMGIESIRVKDQRKIIAFVERKLVAMDEVAGPEGALVTAGAVLGRKEVDRLREAGVDHIRVQGFGSIVGLNGTMIAVVLNFLFLTFFLYVFLWRPVVGILDRRAETISAALENAKKAVARAEEVQRERNELDRETRRERMKVIERSTTDGRRRAEEIITRARREADKMRERAQSALASSVEQLERELESEVPALAGQVAAKLLGRTVPREAFARKARHSNAQGGGE